MEGHPSARLRRELSRTLGMQDEATTDSFFKLLAFENRRLFSDENFVDSGKYRTIFTRVTIEQNTRTRRVIC